MDYLDKERVEALLHAYGAAVREDTKKSSTESYMVMMRAQQEVIQMLSRPLPIVWEHISRINMTHKLCLVKWNTAFFTDKEVKDVWGDDWNDAPYEHNAGSPYEFTFSVEFRALMDTPEDTGGGNSKYSVLDINSGRVPWLVSDKYSGKNDRIYAGATFEEFVRVIYSNEGSILIPAEWVL